MGKVPLKPHLKGRFRTPLKRNSLCLKGLGVAAAILLTLYSASSGAHLGPQGRASDAASANSISAASLPLYLLEDQDDKALFLLIQYEARLLISKSTHPRATWPVFIRALIHRKAGRTSVASEIFRRSSLPGSDFSIYALFHEGEEAFELGDVARAAGFYEKVRKKRPRSELSRLAGFKSALSHQKAGQMDKAIHGYNLYISMDKKGQLSNAAIFKLAEAYYEKGMRVKSAEFSRAIWLDRPQSRYYERARIRYEDLAKEDEIAIPKPSCDKIGRHARRLFKLQRYEKSKAAYDDFFSRCRNARPSGKWQLNYAVSLYYSRDNDKGVALLQGVISEGLKGPKTEAALYWLAKFFYRLKQMPALLWAGDLLSSNFPNSRYTNNIVYLKGSVYGENDHLNKAMRQLKKLIAEHESSQYTDRAWWHIGWIHYSKGDYLNASAAFKGLTARYKTSPLAPDALYWLGRSQEKLGLRNEATNIYKSVASMYPLSYYGMRAAKRLKSLKPDAHIEAQDWAGQGHALTYRPHLRAEFEALSEIFETEVEDWSEKRATWKKSLMKSAKALFEAILYAETEMSAQEDLSAAPGADLAGLSWRLSLCRGPGANSNLRSLLRGLRAAEMELGSRSPWQKPLELAFPRCYRKAVQHYAAINRLDPNLIYSVIMAESKFKEDALSYVGAIGLMQLMPKTARHAASRMNLTPPFEDQLYDPILNLRYGSAYLAELIEIFGGELVPAVASYNAPLQEVILWRTKQGGAASEEFIADIPFYETRKYAQKVLALYEIYNELYPGVGAWQRRPGK